MVSVVRAPLSAQRRGQLRRCHRGFERDYPSAVSLHCIYADHAGLADVEQKHPTWGQGCLGRRRLSLMARVELMIDAITLYGPPPSTYFAPVDQCAIRAAVHSELAGYWSWAVGRRLVWRNDWCVDLGLITMTRADAALTEGRLITKREAIDRLERYDVPPELAAEIRMRRQGRAAPQPITR